MSEIDRDKRLNEVNLPNEDSFDRCLKEPLMNDTSQKSDTTEEELRKQYKLAGKCIIIICHLKVN